ncbi:hypothetical protein HK100_005258 [Physocladia obscura]|uniref:Uncharacterized protein n=1 Tax=Physocladia obscura TaxID=109957 RepID=A0AAD5X9G3_9FUNG|nr:hypothetical protein HK100_005258 [Physocladia obscura]
MDWLNQLWQPTKANIFARSEYESSAISGTPNTQLYSVPREVLQQIIWHLPIDEHLVNVAHVSNVLFGRTILSDFQSARTHIMQYSYSIRPFLNQLDHENKVWRNLPVTYKAAFFEQMFILKNVWLMQNCVVSDSMGLNIIKLFETVSFDYLSFNGIVFRWACSVGNVPLVQMLLDHGVDPAIYGNDALQWAVTRGHEKVVELLLADARVDPATDANFALRSACIMGHGPTVQLLLTDKRSNPCVENGLCLRAAAQNDHVEVVKLLLADGRVDPIVAIQPAARAKKYKALKLLLQDPRVPMETKREHNHFTISFF